MRRIAVIGGGISEVGHRAVVQRVEESVSRLPGLALAGNGLGEVGLSDCVSQARRAAAAVALAVADREETIQLDVACPAAIG
jgi:hypothetical protein